MIQSIEPQYTIDPANRPTITSYTVKFRYQKKVAMHQITLNLDGSLIFACENLVIDLDEIMNKIIHNLQP